MEDFETPREAMLKAENYRLRAEVGYLRRAVDPANLLKFTPIGAVKEMRLSELPETITLPVAASIHGNLSRYGDYHVIATLQRPMAENLIVKYYAPADAVKGKATYFVNELFPYLHRRFISALANAIVPPREAA
jgi:hypothetical protein